MWHENVLGTIGNTPLVRLNRIPRGLPGTVLAKVEFFNPGGSVKDRIGIAMIEDAEAKGQLKPGGTIIEGTSGNTGAGLALAAIAKGYKCVFTTTDKQSPEKLDVLRALGAEVVVCPTNVAPEDPRSYYSVARRLSEEIPNAFYPNQYDHPANTEIHYRTTGPEIWEGTDGRVTHYFAGAGTGGTISGATIYLKEQNPDLLTVGVDPYGSVYHAYFHTGEFDHDAIYPYFTEGVGEDILAGNMDFSVVDDFVQVTDKEAMQMTRRLAREEGLFVGQSCGMVVAGMLQWMQAHRAELSDESVVVVLLPDSGFRYLSKTYNDEWMRRHGFLEEPAGLTVRDLLERRPGTEVVFVSPSDSLAETIGVMMQHNISQLPVMERGAVVGSLSEKRILNVLLEEPEARDRPVAEVMGPPLPVLPSDVSVEALSARLDAQTGAVLIESPDSDHYAIVTRTDLIGALAEAGRASASA